ncbi:MAG: pirin family protein [Nitrospira sp.]|nr:pirin family protein [Candidatus Manganitrophaceae bacterium]HIL35789.1 pirin family protein [Candidatus Manganitrophaceae bacterium]
MDTFRKIRKILKGQPVIEGAGVHLMRLFGSPETQLLDPFLLLDDFHSSNPDDYMAGFPMHPHRGIETITYMLHGEVAHRDSMGNRGVIQGGDVQWMTAGGGIIHEEMPKRSEGELWGFQLWANLPASHKMVAPRYQNIKANEIPRVSPNTDVSIKVICGEVGGIKGPVQGTVSCPEYFDVTITPDAVYEHATEKEHTVFAYVIEGEGLFGEEAPVPILPGNLVLFGQGSGIRVRTVAQPVRFLLVSGQAIREPIAWSGPIVMNTKKELETAFEEYRLGTFLRHN